MNIVYYLPSLYIPGGLEKVIIGKANYFAEHFPNCQVTILTSEQQNKAPYYPLSDKVNCMDIDVVFDVPGYTSLFRKIITYPVKYYRFRQRFTKALHAIKPDITISTLRRDLYFLTSIRDGSVKIGEFHVTRSVHRNCTRRISELIAPLKRFQEKLFTNRLKRLAALIVLTKEEAANWTHLSCTRIIHTPLFELPAVTSDCNKRRVIAVGRYVPEKGFDLLIDCWKIVSQKHPDWELHIHGEGEREGLQQQIDYLQLGDSCILEHAIFDIIDRYCESSVFVLSSRFEDFGMVITEAMSCGLPVVSFACPFGPGNIIRDGVDGLLIENGNVSQLAEKICYLIEHDELRKEMGANAAINVKRFQIEHIADEWHQLFTSLLPSSKTVITQRIGIQNI